MKRIQLKYIVLPVVLLLAMQMRLSAQNTVYPINLETVLEMGGANNLTVEAFRLQQESLQADLAKAREWWLPDLYAGTSVHQLWGNAMNGNGIFFTDVNRQNFWGGLGMTASWKFGEGFYRTEAAELKAKASQYMTRAERNQVLLQVIDAYYDLLAAQLYQKAYSELAMQADTIVQQIQVQVIAELRYESEYLLAKSNLSHLKVEMLKARLQFQQSSTALVRLLNLAPDIQLAITDSILAPISLTDTQIDPSDFEEAYNNRPELKSMALHLESIEVARKTETTGLLIPELQVGGYTSVFGDVFSNISPTNEINARVVWKIPLGRFAYKGSLRQFDAKLALQQNEMAEFKTRINQEILEANQARNIARSQMMMAKEGSQYAREALSQCIQRQQLGTVRPFEILQAQEIFITARLDYLKAVAEFNKAQYAYQVGKGVDL